YRDYTVRAKAGEGIEMAASMKSLISEHWVNEGEVASLSSGVGNVPPAAALTGTNVSQISVTAGVIQVTYSNDMALAGETLTMRPNIPGSGGNSGDSLIWECISTLDNRYLPIECRTP